MNSLSIKKEIVINASRDLIFDALTDSDQIVQFYPLREVVSNWKQGSKVLYKGEIDNIEFTDYGKIEIITRPSEYQYSYWGSNHGSENIPDNHLVINYKLLASDGGTILSLEQHNLKSKDMYHFMNDSVWDFLLNKLKIYIEKKGITNQNSSRHDM